jgi:hypothetical protein
LSLPLPLRFSFAFKAGQGKDFFLQKQLIKTVPKIKLKKIPHESPFLAGEVPRKLI